MFVTDKYIYDPLEKNNGNFSKNYWVSSVKEFCKFYEKIDATLGYDKAYCDIKSYIDALRVVTDTNKDYDYRRNVFFWQSMLHPMVFNSLHRVQFEAE